jgi:hypothetical protein
MARPALKLGCKTVDHVPTEAGFAGEKRRFLAWLGEHFAHSIDHTIV